jgi:hypothetical protein
LSALLRPLPPSLLPAGYNLEGEEVLAVSAENTEGEGLLVETPPEPEPEPEQEGGEEGGWPAAAAECAAWTGSCLRGRCVLLEVT